MSAPENTRWEELQAVMSEYELDDCDVVIEDEYGALYPFAAEVVNGSLFLQIETKDYEP